MFRWVTVSVQHASTLEKIESRLINTRFWLASKLRVAGIIRMKGEDSSLNTDILEGLGRKDRRDEKCNLGDF